MSSDVGLLATEIATIWDVDDRGRLCGTRYPWPQFVLGVAVDGRTVAFGENVPDELAGRLRAAAMAQPWDDGLAGSEPAALHECRRLLGMLGPVEVTSGPGFVLPASVTWPVSPAPRVSGMGGDGSVSSVDDLVGMRPEPWWEPDEWVQLIGGELGPWAILVEGGQVSALCHCARLTALGAEAGVWTHPDFRGGGRAAAVTAAWARLPELGDRAVFYSTSSDNAASQRVAAKLGLRTIGWLWKLRVAATA